MSVEWERVQQIVWLAGFLEGEGCFRVPKGLPIIDAATTDRDVACRAQHVLGTTRLYVQAPHGLGKKPLWRVRLSGDAAAAWMMTLYLLMGLRRRSAIHTALSVWRARRRRDHASKTTCPSGHVYDYIWVLPNGRKRRYCKTCNRRHRDTYAKKKRDERAVA